MSYVFTHLILCFYFVTIFLHRGELKKSNEILKIIIIPSFKEKFTNFSKFGFFNLFLFFHNYAFAMLLGTIGK